MQGSLYEQTFRRSIDPATIQDYWREQLHEVDWIRRPSLIWSRPQGSVHNQWFQDGLVNISYNCIDRHEKTSPDQAALIYDSAMTGQQQTITYRQLKQEVSKLAVVMRRLGVGKGDRVIIYMPMVPQAIYAMLACARIGAIHSVVFGGFAAKELASRIEDAQASLVVSASCGIEPHKIVDYKTILDQALLLCNRPNTKVVLLQREQHRTTLIQNGRDLDYHSLMAMVDLNKDQELAKVEPMNSMDELYILYTSGTTGQPKGIVRDTGGTCMGLNWTMKHIMDCHKGDVYFSSSDIGWVVGHSFIVYGPLLRGATTILYEGKPTGTPDPGAYWRIVEQYKVKGMYTAPTAIRAIRKEDSQGAYIKKYDISSLEAISMAGERCDIPTYNWMNTHFPGVLVNDNYWQTEAGWIISCNFKNLETLPSKAGTATRPVPGFNVKILDEQNQEVDEPNVLGRVCIKQPLPPSFMLGLWGNEQAYLDKYMNDSPGYYVSGDAGYFDKDGYLNVMSRLDDIINTAGHRLSTAQMEEVLQSHPKIVESAVVPVKDELKGEIPVGFVVVKSGETYEAPRLQAELVGLIRKDIGPVAAFRSAIVVDKLPKTRSGKILRATLRKILNGESYGMPPTIEDESVLGRLEEKVGQHGYGVKSNLVYLEDELALQGLQEANHGMLEKQ